MDKRMARFPKESEPYKKHAKIREMMCHKFARTLLDLEEGEELYDPDPESQYDVGGRIMVPSWKVTGSPSKKERSDATKWMLARNPNWDGSTRALRREIAHTFNHSQEKIPGSFGFGIKLSVEVRDFKRHPYKPLPIGTYDVDGNLVLSG
jgi:hypothetical protein